jgi:hypothetical protein
MYINWQEWPWSIVPRTCKFLQKKYIFFNATKCPSWNSCFPPPDCGWMVTDFWSLDAHETVYVVRMRWIVIYGYGLQGGALKLNSTNYAEHGHHANPPLSRNNPHGRTGNRTWYFIISSQKRWPLDYEVGLLQTTIYSLKWLFCNR